ncbi:Uncharacterised protein [Bordetella pertussis]|nr:Uncharacterised protein [Bordetella pertussis]CFO36496.1 Uncharacterised protein [Bordetella pertussis]CFW16649.1 Uncharacterised protein [Bordetella pertussis]CFW44004.1 Uncharacterised protein [Bordetella pertussis]CPJ78780.1 Uncharacterised protein [Bordetella pertussis]
MFWMAMANEKVSRVSPNDCTSGSWYRPTLCRWPSDSPSTMPAARMMGHSGGAGLTG